ncbi:hypothetical protein RIR_jg3138.t1 [Rhizophagus irregularis DAOM 181602=DAOM 197198]|nr:hypothetical protein RIR_jg3138.t1 [Rhizophagus irregularis DAOM 181602=DAOM 197198]
MNKDNHSRFLVFFTVTSGKNVTPNRKFFRNTTGFFQENFCQDFTSELQSFDWLMNVSKKLAINFFK